MSLSPLYEEAVGHHRRGALAEAEALYARLLEADPDNAVVLNNRGTALQGLGRPEEALACYERALALRPEYADALNNRGSALRERGRLEEALESYERALTLRPGHADTLYNRALALQDLGRQEDALAGYDRALAARPDFAVALSNRGNVLLALKRFEEALASYDRALALLPDYADAQYNRANALAALGRDGEALAGFGRALALRPGHADTLCNRGNVFLSLRRFAEARADYEAALAADPDHHAFGGLAYTVLNLCDWPRVAEIAGEIEARVASRRPLIPPFALLGYCNDAALQLRYTRNYVEDALPRPSVRKPASCRHEKIRIGYLSADFRNHATAYLMAELFERHSRSGFEVLGISLGPDDGSAMRARLVKSFDRFHDVRAQSDEAAAKLLRALEVDIAIDLGGHTMGARPAILSHRPCPVQVNYLGYPGTMGADFIDYIIADRIVAPFDRQPFFTEKIVHLPDSYQANDSTRAGAAPPPSRREAGLPERGFVFCCFNNNWKITAPLFDIWMRLLVGVPGSVLWLFEDNEGAAAALRAAAAARGIDPGRLVFAPRLKSEDHLARHRLADLFLDTLPVNAHTTASDALWMGLPLVTCKGETFAGRVAASLLHAIGLPELVTESLEDYEALARKLAATPELLQSVRRTLADNRRIMPLFDTERLCRHIESAYTTMCETSARGEAPRSFRVDPA